MPGADPDVGYHCSPHSAVGHSKMDLALGPGTIARILPRRDHAWGSGLLSALQTVFRFFFRKNTTPFDTRDSPKREGGANPRPDPVTGEF